MIKILCIGNSFSQDASAHVEFLCPDIFIRNLFIGGCSLEKHCEMIESGEKAYQYQWAGDLAKQERHSIKQAILAEKWDYITVQQVSYLTGNKQSYYPYLQKLIDYIKSLTSAKIVFHQTWAYEPASQKLAESVYLGDYEKMNADIIKTTREICKEFNLEMIPNGEYIAKIREYDYFREERGGITLSRDGFHLSYSHGRTTAGLGFIKFFTGKMPEFLLRNDLTEGMQIIKKIIFE